jgi:hypothetical protein
MFLPKHLISNVKEKLELGHILSLARTAFSTDIVTNPTGIEINLTINECSYLLDYRP